MTDPEDTQPLDNPAAPAEDDAGNPDAIDTGDIAEVAAEDQDTVDAAEANLDAGADLSTLPDGDVQPITEEED